MARAALFVLPSRSEGLPYALLEAGAAGRAVVATAVGGMPEVVGEDAGILVPPEDPDALAAAIGSLLGDDALRARLADALAARVRRDFGSGSMAEAYLRLYRSVRRERPGS
jgi:glycosyltransferase involved in cell wall biosynthesis